MNKIKEIILVGGSGFIGSKLAERISRNNNFHITVIHVGALEDSQKIESVSYKQIDLSQDSKEAHQIIQKADTAVLMTQPQESLIKNFLRLAQDSELKKIIYTSTLLLYPDSSKQHNELDPLDPVADYEKGKYEEEMLLRQFANKKTRVCIARLANVYGDKMNRGIVDYLLKALLNNSIFTINGDGEHVRDYIFIDDVTSALEQLILNDQQEDLQIYNVCTSSGHSINQLILELEKVAGKKIATKNAARLKEKLSVIGSNQKIKKELNYEVQFDFIEGLAQTYENYSI